MTTTTSKRLITTTTTTKPRHLINISQLTNDEFSNLINKASHLKSIYKSEDNIEQTQKNHQKLLGKLVALLFSKRSTRTRISTEGAASFFGAQPMFLGKDDIQLGVNESILDTTKVISSMTSCIFARVNSHLDIQQLCKYSSVPIINSLCDKYHPLQAIADLLTIREKFGETKNLKLAWIGDANNVINDLSIACLKMGINVSISIPKSIQFDSNVESDAKKLATEQNLKFEIVNDPKLALENANIIVTDTWISMGEENQKQAKLKQFENYQINQNLLSDVNLASNWIFMHCLPRHQEEVADDVFYSDNSVVFEEAENRLYAAMAVIEAFVINKGDLLK
ncbi:ARG3 [Candida jiufengensis]|uniref:ARG3 n=1 Tax=Candida jiufengensis TaxID=497108 RepID=UPI0022257453|nr:ARG3 [Candida jiufengensis]KAI5956934.1 ARG3 [Candida jiufengensis]